MRAAGDEFGNSSAAGQDWLLVTGEINAKIKSQKSKLWSCRCAATTSLILHFDI
jgi:hypothetical protein